VRFALRHVNQPVHDQRIGRVVQRFAHVVFPEGLHPRHQFRLDAETLLGFDVAILFGIFGRFFDIHIGYVGGCRLYVSFWMENNLHGRKKSRFFYMEEKKKTQPIDPIVERVQQIFDKSGLKMAEIADALGLSDKLLYAILNGTRAIRDYHIKLIANVFDADEFWLRHGTFGILRRQAAIQSELEERDILGAWGPNKAKVLVDALLSKIEFLEMQLKVAPKNPSGDDYSVQQAWDSLSEKQRDAVFESILKLGGKVEGEPRQGQQKSSHAKAKR